MRILIADDHEVVRKGVMAVLAARPDLEICGEASNGQEAVQLAVLLQPDLIILDLTMPGLNGIGAAERIRQILPQIPILVLSMHDGRSLQETFRRIGVQGFVPKKPSLGKAPGSRRRTAAWANVLLGVRKQKSFICQVGWAVPPAR